MRGERLRAARKGGSKRGGEATRSATFLLLIITGLALLLPSPAHALNLIRDAETESYLHDSLAPLLRAADMPEDSISLYIVNNPALNAFVAGGTNIFIHTGLIMESDRAEMIQGVLAHELGHITGGHLVRAESEMKHAAMEQIVTTVLSAVVAAAGSGDAGGAIMHAGSQMAQAGFFAFTRAQEQAADQAAITTMTSAQVPVQGLLDTMELLRAQERLRPDNGVPYLRSHPLTRERISFARQQVMHLPASGSDAALQARHARVQAKLRGFLLKPELVQKLYLNNPESFAARYARAIAEHRRSNLKESAAILAALIAEQPDDAYLHELMGQVQFEHGQIAPAVAAYAKADSLLPNTPLIELSYAQALLADKTQGTDAPKSLLLRVTQKEPDNLAAWQQLAALWQRENNPGMGDLAQAEIAYLRRDHARVKKLAARAKTALKPGTAAHTRADDLAAFAEEALKKKDQKDAVPDQGFSL